MRGFAGNMPEGNKVVACCFVFIHLRCILSHRIGPTLQPVFISKKLEQGPKPKEAKPSIVNQQCVVYHFVSHLCDADYVGYTARHLFQRVAEHKNSAIENIFMMRMLGATS